MKTFLRIGFLLIILAGCDKSPDTIVDTSGLRPNLLGVSLTNSTVNTDTILVGGQKSPDDNLSIPVGFGATIGIPPANVQSFRYRVTRNSDGTEAASGSLPLTGMEQLQVRSIVESITLQKMFTMSVLRSDIGIFTVEISAVDESGLESNAFRLPLSILRLNRPPQIVGLSAPDTLQIPSAGYIRIALSVSVQDPDGARDVTKVQFTSILPDGTPSKSGPIQMFDDGSMVDLGGITSGDVTASDGVYTRTVQLQSNATRGTYTFNFIAIDRSLDTSNVLSHTIVVE